MNLKMSKGKWIAVGLTALLIIVLSVVISVQKERIGKQEAVIKEKSDSLIIAVNNIGELQLTITEINSQRKECENENIKVQSESARWKLKYYEQKATQTDCESLVDHAVLNSTPPDKQGLILANRLITSKSGTSQTGGFWLVVPQQPDHPDQ